MMRCDVMRFDRGLSESIALGHRDAAEALYA